MRSSQPIQVPDSVGLPVKDIRTGCPDAPSDGFVSHGGGRATITLRATDRDRGGGTWAMTGCCDNVPDMRVRHVYPDGMRATCHYEVCGTCSQEEGPRTFLSEIFVFAIATFLLQIATRFWFIFELKKMSANKKTVSSVQAGDAREKPTDKLSVKEFRDRFCNPNGVIVEFLNGRTSCRLRKLKTRHHLFKRTIQHRASVSSSSIVQGIPSLFPDSTSLHPSQHSPGADGMQHYKHVVQSRPHAAGGSFVYSLKKGKNDIFSMSLTCLPSIGDGAAGFDEGRGEGTRGGPGRRRGYWSIRRGLFLQTIQCFRTLGEVLWDAAHCAEPNGRCPGVLGDLPIYKEVKEADVEKHRALLIIGEEKKRGNSTEGSRTETQCNLPSKESPSEKRSW
ncbi:hypothetical protein CK203_064423 [Vitis vinifera]|uniref:Uncharacterized protein n=1 Tax=Vitis vinifera TaxID=29760 RepID=A0A438FQH0_VITVI|nr:hypothetical protein CK203_064423 [Vitis vinifera]